MNLSWVVGKQIAAASRPVNLRHDLEALQDERIEAIVSLTESPLSPALVEEFGFEYRHIPVPDFSAPQPEQIDVFVSFVRRMRAAGKRVVVHCGSGRGRTGAMLACYFVSRGQPAAQAVARIRRIRPGAIETPEQEKAVADYARRLRRRRRKH